MPSRLRLKPRAGRCGRRLQKTLGSRAFSLRKDTSHDDHSRNRSQGRTLCPSGTRPQKDVTVYDDDPVAVAGRFASAAPSESTSSISTARLTANRETGSTCRRSCNRSTYPCRPGGGIRSIEAIEHLLGDRCRQGDPRNSRTQRARACQRGVPGVRSRRVLVGIDARNGLVAVEGWVEESEYHRRSPRPRDDGGGCTRDRLYGHLSRRDAHGAKPLEPGADGGDRRQSGRLGRSLVGR